MTRSPPLECPSPRRCAPLVRVALLLLIVPLLPVRAAGSARIGKTLPLPGEVVEVGGRTAFLIPAPSPAANPSRPWVWYAPALARYPGVAKAAGAHGLSAAELEARLAEHNPVDRLPALAAWRVPLFAIHGDADRIVPLEANSGLLRERYRALGGSMALIVPAGQGHSMWLSFFQSEALVAFVKAHTRP